MARISTDRLFICFKRIYMFTQESKNLQYKIQETNMDKEQKDKKNDQADKFGEAKKAIDLVKEMKGFYESQNSSTLDLQNRVIGKGFSFLNQSRDQIQLIVEMAEAQQIINMIKELLKEQVPTKIYTVASQFLNKWKALPLFRMIKQEILFDMNSTSSACFFGVYFKKGAKNLYVCYKFIKNAFKLAPDIYVMHESESESALFGAFKTSSKRDYLQELNRGFTREDLTCLLELASAGILNLEMVSLLE